MSVLSGQVALVVGGSSSIGPALCNRLLAAGARVIATYHSKLLPRSTDSFTACTLDLGKDNSIHCFRDKLHELAPTLDVVIFLSGVLPGRNLAGYSFADIDRVMSINFNGHAKLLSLVLPKLNGDSRVLMFSSISGQRGSFDPIYAASKGALLSFVKSLGTQVPRGARINAIAPGLIEGSTMSNDMTEERRQFHRSQTTSQSLLSSGDLANVVLDLCLDHWRHLNGACIDLNGGQYVR